MMTQTATLTTAAVEQLTQGPQAPNWCASLANDLYNEMTGERLWRSGPRGADEWTLAQPAERLTDEENRLVLVSMQGALEYASSFANGNEELIAALEGIIAKLTARNCTGSELE